MMTMNVWRRGVSYVWTRIRVVRQNRDVGTGGHWGHVPPPRFCKKRKIALFTVGILPHFRKFKVFESAFLAAKVPLKFRVPPPQV